MSDENNLYRDASAMLARYRALESTDAFGAFAEALRGEIEELEVVLMMRDSRAIDAIVNSERPGVSGFARLDLDGEDLRTPAARRTLDWLATAGQPERPRMAFVLDEGQEYNELDGGYRARAVITRQVCDRLGIKPPVVGTAGEADAFYGAVDRMIDELLAHAQENDGSDYDECPTADEKRSVVMAPRAWLDLFAANVPGPKRAVPLAPIAIASEDGFFQASRDAKSDRKAIAHYSPLATTRNEADEVIFHYLVNKPGTENEGILPDLNGWSVFQDQEVHGSFGDLVRMAELVRHHEGARFQGGSDALTDLEEGVRACINYACIESTPGSNQPHGSHAALNLFTEYDAARNRAYPYSQPGHTPVFLTGPAGREQISACSIYMTYDEGEGKLSDDDDDADSDVEAWADEKLVDYGCPGYHVRPMETVRIDATRPEVRPDEPEAETAPGMA